MPLLDLLFSMLWLFLFFAWIFLVITVFIDIFRSPDLSGWAKALWVLFVIIVPLLGVLVYLIARGDDMNQRRIDEAAATRRAQDDYIRDVTATSSADELSKLNDLRQNGIISQQEFDAQKSKVLGV